MGDANELHEDCAGHQEEIRYLINQDYSFGQSVRTQARAMLKASVRISKLSETSFIRY